jgi:hypothetical protein
MSLRRSLRGRPLTVLSCVLVAWVAMRVATWSPPQWSATPAEALDLPQPFAFASETARHEFPMEEPAGFGRGPITPSFLLAYADLPVPQRAGGVPGGWGPPVYAYAPQSMFRPVPVPVYYPAPGGGDPRNLAALAPPPGWAAGPLPGAMPPPLPPRELAGASVGYGGQAVADAPAPVPLSPGLAEGNMDRWSADVWTLARKETGIPLASGRPVYGGSQAGAVLRYRLAPGSAYRPMAYLRANTALGAVRESEIALGLAARPVASLPIVLAAEARAFRSASGRKSFRPAALAYTELPPFGLPLGFTGEAYLQGGYVGGAFRTGFVDGQVRVDRPLIDVAGHRLKLGGGVWGGAQKGASRLDAGPGMSAMVDIWGRSSRVSLDWRLRLAGDAEPKSGPAVTVSAGF